MGFTSEVMRVWLEWSKDEHSANVDLPEKVIVKTPMIKCLDFLVDNMMNGGQVKWGDEPLNSESVVQMIHKTECDAYRILYQADPHPVPLPLIYLIRDKDPGVIIMEDLDDRAGIISSIAVGLNFGQWKSIAVHLARLHAWSLTTNIEWQSVLPGQEAMLQMFKSFVEMSKTGLKVVTEKFKEELGHIDESLYDKEITFEKLVRNYEIYKRNTPNVMLHGDTWINNIMFLKDPKNPARLTDEVAAFFDWQISTSGCGLNDLARLTAWCVPHELRRLQKDVILKIYFDEFKSKVDSAAILGADFTFDKASKFFNHTLAVNGLLGVPMVDFMLNFIGKIHEDQTGWRKETLLNRVKASYDDCAAYFGSSESKAFLEL